MKILYRKYKKNFSVFSLLLYICFLTTAVFHSHNYHYQSNIVISELIPNNDSKVKDPFLDDQANCRLVQFLQNHYSILLVNSHDFLIFPASKNISLSFSEEFYDSPKLFTAHLRAPPKV